MGSSPPRCSRRSSTPRSSTTRVSSGAPPAHRTCRGKARRSSGCARCCSPRTRAIATSEASCAFATSPKCTSPRGSETPRASGRSPPPVSPEMRGGKPRAMHGSILAACRLQPDLGACPERTCALHAAATRLASHLNLRGNAGIGPPGSVQGSRSGKLDGVNMRLGDFAMLIAGWALGILSSPITDAIRRRSVKQRITRAVVTELRSLQDSFAMVVLQVSRRRGNLTHSLLEALMSTLVTSGLTPVTGKALRAIEDLMDGQGRARASSPPSEQKGSRTFLSLKTQGVPFLESHLQRLDFYTHETQRQLFEIRAGWQVFNQQADEAMQYHLMTFAQGIAPEHLTMLNTQLENCYERAAERASELVSLIAVLLQNPEMRTRGWVAWPGRT